MTEHGPSLSLCADIVQTFGDSDQRLPHPPMRPIPAESPAYDALVLRKGRPGTPLDRTRRLMVVGFVRGVAAESCSECVARFGTHALESIKRFRLCNLCSPTGELPRVRSNCTPKAARMYGRSHPEFGRMGGRSHPGIGRASGLDEHTRCLPIRPKFGRTRLKFGRSHPKSWSNWPDVWEDTAPQLAGNAPVFGRTPIRNLPTPPSSVDRNHTPLLRLIALRLSSKPP